jgi:WD40 repeat protein
VNSKYAVPAVGILFLCIVLALPAEQRVHINTGHTHRINDFSLQETRNLLFSAGDDGTLRVWDVNRIDNGRGRLLYKLQISHLPIVKFAVHPRLSQVALVETDRINTFHLSVWDYRTGKKIFSHKIEEIPLFIQYSPMGTYLVYGRTEWKSLVFLNSGTGTVEPVLETGFGIVSDIFLSSTEKTLLSYSPSGIIRYWSIDTATEKTSFSTVGDLLNIQFAKNGVYMIGTRGRSVYLINLVNGSVEARQEFEFIRGIYLDAASEQLFVYFTENSRPRFQTFKIDKFGSSWALNPVSRSISAPEFAEPPLALKDSTVFFCRNNGEMYTQSIYSPGESVFSSSILLDVNDIGFIGNSILISGREYILKLTSKVFGEEGAEAALSPSSGEDANFSTQRFENPLGTAAGILSLDKNRFLIFPKDGEGGSLYLYRDGFFRPLDTFLSGPVKSALPYGSDVLLLEESGNLRIIDPANGDEKFSYSSFGVQSAVRAWDGSILVARNKTDLINTTLLSINPSTSETVPIPERNLLTFHLAYDEASRSLFSLGFENRRGSIRTVLKQHQGRNYNRVSTLLSYPGEDNEASLAVDPDGRVFTSLGYGDVHMFTWNGFTTMEKVEHIPRLLRIHAGRLFSLNGDSSISIWDVESGKLEMTLHVFKDLSWIVSFSDGSYYATAEARRWIHIAE